MGVFANNPLVLAIRQAMANRQQSSPQAQDAPQAMPQVSQPSQPSTPGPNPSQIGGMMTPVSGMTSLPGVLGRMGIGMVPGQAQRQMMGIQAAQQQARADAVLRAQIAQQQAQQQQADLAERTRSDKANEGISQQRANTEQQGVQQSGEFQQGELQNQETGNEIKQEQTSNDLALGTQRNKLEAQQIDATNKYRMAQLQATTDLRKQILGLREGTVSQKVYQPALDADDRLMTMRQNLGDALQGDQQAMLSLLSNHLGMTMGLQKGARLNQAIIEEAEKSAPWLQGIKAKFDSRGYLSGVTLTPQQMNQMVKLAEAKDGIAWQKADSMARAMGVYGGKPQSLVNMPSTPAAPSTSGQPSTALQSIFQKYGLPQQ